VEETDAKNDDDDDNPARGLGFPSNEAIAQFEDYRKEGVYPLNETPIDAPCRDTVYH
jgi:hypothetical protein